MYQNSVLEKIWTLKKIRTVLELFIIRQEYMQNFSSHQEHFLGAVHSNSSLEAEHRRAESGLDHVSIALS